MATLTQSTTLTQNNRVGVLTTPLGQDVLCLVRFDGHEGLSEVFEFHAEAISEKKSIDFNDALGRSCTVKITSFGREREFTGILVEAHSAGLSEQGEYFTYHITLRPWLWLLTRTSDCRVFHEKKAPDIIEQVFKDRGFSSGTDYELKLTDSNYPKRDYTVQYRETDFNFVTRLMEKEGIYYYFEFKNGQHKLILAELENVASGGPGPRKTALPSGRRAIPPARGAYYRLDQFTPVEDRKIRTQRLQLRKTQREAAKSCRGTGGLRPRQYGNLQLSWDVQGKVHR